MNDQASLTHHSRSHPRRIVFMAPFGLRPKGTVSVRALPLARALARRGHHLTLIIPPWDDPAHANQRWNDAGVDVINLPLIAPPWRHLHLLSALLQEARRYDPHILHIFKPKGVSGLSATIFWYTRMFWRPFPRLIVDTDDWEGPGGWNTLHEYPRLLKHFFTWQERHGLTHAHGVTVASRALETLVWAMGVSPTKVCYLPNGSTLPIPHNLVAAAHTLRAQYGLDDHPVALLYTRFFEFNLERVANIWAQVVANLPHARLLVIGRGLFGEDEAFRTALALRGVADTMHHLGWVEPERLAFHLRMADVALYPMDDTLVNRTKCPVKLADLLAVGLPVVGEAVGQVGDYLAHGAGIPVPPNDESAFVTALVRLLRDHHEAARVGHQAQIRLQTHFTWEVQAARLEAFYERLCHSPP